MSEEKGLAGVLDTMFGASAMSSVEVSLDSQDYRRAVKFSLRLWFSGKSTTNWRGSVKRGIGEYIEDFVPGKLAEIAFCKFLQNRDLKAEPNFEIYRGPSNIDLGDVRIVLESGRVIDLPVDIKATKPKSLWACVEEREFKARPYEVYVWTVVDIPTDHLAVLIADAVRNGNLADIEHEISGLAEKLGSIRAVIRGFALRSDLEMKAERFKKGDSLYDPMSRKKLSPLYADNRCIEMYRLRSNWDELVSYVIELIKRSARGV